MTLIETVVCLEGELEPIDFLIIKLNKLYILPKQSYFFEWAYAKLNVELLLLL